MLLRGKLEGGRGGATFRVAEHELERGGDDEGLGPPHDRARARLSRRRRGCRRGASASWPGACAASSAHAVEPLPARLRARRRPAVAGGRARAPLTGPRRSRRSPVARRRLAFEELFLFQLALVRRRRTRQRGARGRAARRAGRPRAAAGSSRCRSSSPTGSARRSRRSTRDLASGRPDAAPADGRGRLRQDRRRAVRDAARRRGGHAGGADGADRDARRAALRDDRRA